MRTTLESAVLLYRVPTRDRDEVGFLPGDVWEFDEPRIEEVNPATRSCTGALQCFQVGEDGQRLVPVARGSWPDDDA